MVWIQNDSGTGLYAYYSANNCQGISYGNGYGVYTPFIAIGCYDSSSSGTALKAFIANSSYGSTEAITFKYNTP